MGKFDAKLLENVPLLTNSAPFAYAEAYKTLRTNLSFASISKQYKKIIITSAIPNEGKSTVAVNLAATLAESDARVLLIDCDLRNPTLRRLLRVRPEFKEGLTSLLTGNAALEECVLKHSKLKCDVLLAGATPPNPVELLSSPQMKQLLDILSETYDYIICDTPPVSVVTDAAALSRFCDGVILVVRQKTSTREQVWAAKRNLDAVQANILGTILSCYDMSDDTQAVNTYYGGYYHYGQSTGRRKRKKWYD
jgi:capsular exopolysaccharide synthesis family protein